MRLTRTVHEPGNPILNVSKREARPHSPMIRIGDYVFVSGMVPTDPNTGERALGPIAGQIANVLSNLQSLLESNGFSLDDVVRLNITLADLLEADDMWRVFRKFFPHDPPAANLMGMQLSFGNGVEIETTAYVGKR